MGGRKNNHGGTETRRKTRHRGVCRECRAARPHIIPVTAAPIEFTEQVNGAIISRQLDLLRKAESIAKGFTDLVVQGADLQRLLRQLARIVGNPVVLGDPAHQLIDFASRDVPADDVLTAWESHSRQGHYDAEMGRMPSAFGSPPCMWSNVTIRGELWGRLHVLEWERSLDEIDELALDRAVAAVALALLGEAEANRLASHARDTLITDILRDRYGSANDFLRRADSLRANLRGLQLAVLSVATIRAASSPAERDASRVEWFGGRHAMQRDVQAAIESATAVGLCGLYSDQVLAIVGVAPSRSLEATMTAVGEDICERVGRRFQGCTPIVGISDEASPQTLSRACDQALEAVADGRGRTSARVVRFADLGLQHLLLRLSDGPELARFVEAELSPLLEYDARKKTALVATLRAYFDSGTRKSLAAHSLSIERRTLYHRIERINQILRSDIDDQETALRLRLALRGLDLLRQRSRVESRTAGRDPDAVKPRWVV